MSHQVLQDGSGHYVLVIDEKFVDWNHDKFNAIAWALRGHCVPQNEAPTLATVYFYAKGSADIAVRLMAMYDRYVENCLHVVRENAA